MSIRTHARPTTTRAAVEQLLCRIGHGDRDRGAEQYAEHVDWKVNRPESEHGRSVTRGSAIARRAPTSPPTSGS